MNRSFWTRIGIKVLAVMSLPLVCSVVTDGAGYSWFYSSILFTIQGSSGRAPMLINTPYPGGPWPDIVMVIATLTLCVPGIC
ncbi:MAG: hypothetical protein ACFFCK_09855, partial [Promethearchaeota archaeon]